MMSDEFIETDFSGGSDGNGLITGSVRWWVPTRDQAWAVGETVVDGIPYKRREVAQDSDKLGFYATLFYEGLSDGIDPPADESRLWSGQITERQDPIETHPKFEELKKTYGGVVENGKVKWPETISGGRKGSGIGSGAAKGTRPNPMLNVTHYPVLLGEVTYTRVVRNLPSDLFSVVGKIHQALPSSSGLTTPEGYVFVQALPKWSGRGNAFQLTDTYKLTPAEGWLDLIYKILNSR
jgi:hypothetical protein